MHVSKIISIITIIRLIIIKLLFNKVYGTITIIIPINIIKNTGKLCLITLISLSKSNFGNIKFNSNPPTLANIAYKKGINIPFFMFYP